MKQIFFVLFLLLLFTVPVGASLVAYDGLNVAPGPLNAVASGWNLNAWDVQNQTPTYQVQAGSLTYGDLLTSGNKAIGGGAWTSAGLTLKMPATWEADNEWVPYRKQGPGDIRYRAGKEETTLWASFLVQDWVAGDAPVVHFANSHIGWNPGQYGIGVEVKNNNWQLLDIAAGTYTDTGVGRTLNDTYLMVLKFEFLTGGEGESALWTDGSDRITLYVNPTEGLALPDVAGTVLNTSTDISLLNVQFYPGSGANNGALDELRFGTSYADVTPIPEPATMLLLGFGGAVCIVRRGRR